MSRAKILVQLDSDPQCSVFDSVVAVDAGVDQLFRHAQVTESQVQGLVHGAMFTRGPQDLKSTAIFVGGSQVDVGERLLAEVTRCFFGPMRVSVMLDANGANTTAAAAVLAAGRHLDLAQTRATVLAATGPVGQRVVRLLARQGCQVHVGSRKRERAQQVCEELAGAQLPGTLFPFASSEADQLASALHDSQLVVAAGAAGIELLSAQQRQATSSLQVAIDLNAVPPVGLGGIEITDKAQERDGQICYGAIGVGGTKMKIHKAAIARLFESNDQILDAEAIYELGASLV